MPLNLPKCQNPNQKLLHWLMTNFGLRASTILLMRGNHHGLHRAKSLSRQNGKVADKGFAMPLICPIQTIAPSIAPKRQQPPSYENGCQSYIANVLLIGTLGFEPKTPTTPRHFDKI